MQGRDKNPKKGLGYLLELATGHYRSKVLFVATNLGVFTLLSKKAATLEEIAGELKIDERPARMLLDACVSLELLEKNEILYSNTRTSDLYLVEGSTQYMEPAFFKFDEHSYLLFDKLEDAIVSNSAQISTENVDDPALSPSCMLIGNRDDYRRFISAMDPIAQWPANSIATSFDFSPFNTLLDLGGGSGVFSAAIVEKNKNMNAIVFDLFHVCEIGQKRMEEKGLSGKVRYLAGDYFKDDLPEGVDVALLSNVLHGYGPEKCTTLLKKVYEQLPSNGAVIVSDTMLDEDGCSPEIAVFLSFYYLLITEDGRNYTVREYADMLKEVGFTGIKTFKSSAGTSFVSGGKV